MKYYKIINNKAVACQIDINGFDGLWIQEQEGFGIGDLYDEQNGWSKPSITEFEAKEWRNQELKNTDFIVPLTDFPNHAAWLTYRQELRDWTTTSDFPDTKPTAPAELN